jgi:hypothetical protein
LARQGGASARAAIARLKDQQMAALRGLADKVGKANPGCRKLANMFGRRGHVVVGETMERVQAAAAKIPGAKILDDMPKFNAMGLNADQVTSAMMQYNRRWILAQMRSGRTIVDIGIDTKRINRSIFYEMEQNMLRNYQKLHGLLNIIVQ